MPSNQPVLGGSVGYQDYERSGRSLWGKREFSCCNYCTTAYALGCVAAAALGALLYTVVTSDTVENALQGIFERALHEG